MSECDRPALVSQIENHFAAMGWQPLLPIKVEGMRALCCEKLEQLVPNVLNAKDRLAAVTAILEVLIRREPPPDEPADHPDSAVLRLRSSQS
jgi:hypothetical protein